MNTVPQPGEKFRASRPNLLLMATAMHMPLIEPERSQNPYEAQIYDLKTAHGKTFLRDETAPPTALPKMLPKGLPYAAKFLSFDALHQKGALDTLIKDQVSLSSEELKLLYEAKCMDQNLPTSWERHIRFMELVSTNCKGSFFCLPESGLGPMTAEALAHVLSTNKSYSILDLSRNRLKDEGATSIAALLRYNKSLVHIGLSSNDIGYVGGIAIASALSENNTVVSLDLGAHSGVNGNHIGTHGAEAIGELLKRNSVLARLNLSSNGLGSHGVEHVSKGLTHNNSLTTLDISSNTLSFEGGKTVAAIIRLGKIIHLSVQRNNFGDMGGKYVFQALEESIENGFDTLEYLDIADNDLGEKSAKALQKVLTSSSSLKHLNLSKNPFASAGKYIATALAENKSLKVLYLNSCGLREDVGAFFSSALEANSTLTDLQIAKNGLKGKGTIAFAKGATQNKGLRTLDISSNKIGDVGGEAMANLLKGNYTLRELNVRRNAMGAKTGEVFVTNLRGNTTLEHLDTTYNDFTYKCLMAITGFLERNRQISEKLIVPKLSNEVETLAPKEKELTQVEEEIQIEKRITKDRSEQMLRKNEEGRVISEKLRRDIQELEKKLEKVRYLCEASEVVFRRCEEKNTNEMSTIMARKTNMDLRIQQERERTERYQKEIEKMRRQIRQLEEAENERLKPLLTELATTEADRAREMNDAKFEAEKLAALELHKLELESQKEKTRKKSKK